MISQNIQDLIHKYLNGSATLQEKEMLDAWYKAEQINSQQWAADSADEEVIIKQEIFNSINAVISPVKVRSLNHRIYKYIAAASILLLTGSTAYFLYTSKTIVPKANIVTNDLPGGSNGAVLTLANGEKIALKSNALSTISPAKIAGISSYNDSVLKYEDLKHQGDREITYNTLTTPYGHQFSLVLSDGTKVFMNAGSTLQYPVVFKGSERLVKLTGEAYFEVVHNSKIPFRIKAGEQLIEDIGTSFNVNAYDDENFSAVTLVEGSVKVQKKLNGVIINPGQQAITYKERNEISVKAADFDSALAWKNGLFHFKDEKLDVVLKQIARWYDLKIEYQGAIPPKTINGEIYRNMNGVEVLSILRSLGVNYKLEGNKLIVKK
jgi:transmembrane sensor